MAEQEDRKDITKDQFFSSLDSNGRNETRVIIEKLITWSNWNNFNEKYTTGERAPAFTPLIQRPDKPSRTMYVQADGWIVIPIRWMSDRPPFSIAAKREELVDRLNMIPGAVITELGVEGFPKFPIASLTSAEFFDEFVETLNWMIHEIKDVDAGDLGTKPIGRSIWVFGNTDSSDLGFPTFDRFREYINGGVFIEEGGRYRHTLIRNVDVIILSKDGLAYGHFEILRRELPSDSDIRLYPPTRSVYLVRTSHLYTVPVPLADLSITRLRFGRKISEGEFQEILKRADGIQEIRNIRPIPDELPSPTKYFEGAVTTVAVNSYERNSNARLACLKHHGYQCAVCGFSMAELYGDIGHSVIHVHHLCQLSTIGMEYEINPIEDLRPVCPNCHAILHTESPAMSIDQLQTILTGRKPIPWPRVE